MQSQLFEQRLEKQEFSLEVVGILRCILLNDLLVCSSHKPFCKFFKKESELLRFLSSSAEEDLGILLNNKLSMSWQHDLVTKKISGILERIRKGIASR